MKVLIYLLPFVLVGIAFYAGYTIGKSKPALGRDDRRRLIALDNLVDDLSVKAAEHSMLGDDFAVIVASDINTTRKELTR